MGCLIVWVLFGVGGYLVVLCKFGCGCGFGWVCCGCLRRWLMGFLGLGFGFCLFCLVQVTSICGLFGMMVCFGWVGWLV